MGVSAVGVDTAGEVLAQVLTRCLRPKYASPCARARNCNGRGATAGPVPRGCTYVERAVLSSHTIYGPPETNIFTGFSTPEAPPYPSK
eukprot:3779055-Prymnesium_polylepis.1